MGEPIPERLLNSPSLDEAYLFYIDAFFELSSERQIAFGEGPIPITAILNYCGHYGIVGTEESDFVMFIRALDAAYLKKQNKKNGKSKNAKKENGNAK